MIIDFIINLEYKNFIPTHQKRRNNHRKIRCRNILSIGKLITEKVKLGNRFPTPVLSGSGSKGYSQNIFTY